MKILQNFVVILAIAVIICLCYFSMFNTFQTDDYGFSASTNNKGYATFIVDIYNNWGGRYFSFSLNALNPAGNLSWNWLPKIFPIFLWSNLIFAFFLNFKLYFGLNNGDAIKKSLIAFLFYTVALASLSEHYFWITGSIIYFLPHIFALYFIYIIGIEKPKIHHLLLKFLLIIVIMGSNEIIALFLLLFLAFHLYKNFNKTAVFQFLFGLVFFCFAFFAPGNFVRLNPEETGFFTSFIKKFGVFIANSAYVSLKIGLLVPLFAFVFHQEILKINERLSIKDRWSFQIILGIVLAFTGFIMIASERSLETILIYSLLSTSILLVHYFPKIRKFWMISVIAIFIPSIMLFPYKIIYFNLNFNLNNIGKELLHSNLKDFETEIYLRHETLRNSKKDHLELKPIENIPKILYFGELGTEKDRNYINQQLQDFYHKKSVVLKK